MASVAGSAATGFTLVDGTALSVTGVTAGTVRLATTAGDLTLAGAVGGTTSVALSAAAGAIGQTAGVVTTGLLTASGTGDVTLNDANLVTTLGQLTAGAGSAASLTNAQALSVTGPVSGGTASLTTTAGALTLASGATETGATVTLSGAAGIAGAGGAGDRRRGAERDDQHRIGRPVQRRERGRERAGSASAGLYLRTAFRWPSTTSRPARRDGRGRRR